MKKLRKVGALLIALALVLSMFPLNGLIAFAEEAVVDTTVTTDAPAEDETATPAEPVEEVSAEVEEAAILLQNLNILKGDESGNLNLTGDVTRAEFATFVVRMIGQEEVALATAGKQIFDDVAADHWGNGYIDVAYNAGIILGYGDGNFGPESPVTYEQAVKMIVCALGYGDLASERGGWPTGYLRVADEKKITKGIKILGGEPAKRGDIVSMIYNSLEIDVMRSQKAIKDGVEATSYTVVPGDNVLTYFLGLEKAEGIVTANELTRLNSADKSAKTKEDQIELNFTDLFETGSIDALDFLGQTVSVYYELDTKKDKKNVVAIKPQEDNTITVVNGDDILMDQTTETLLVWEKDDDAAEYDLAEDAAVVKNKRFTGFLNSIELSTITPDNGTVTLVDNDGDDTADVIFVDAFETWIVDKTTDTEIYDKYTRTYYGLYVGSPYYTCTIKDKDGKNYDIKKIKEWDVICVYRSGERPDDQVQVRNAIVSTEKVTGKVTKKSYDGRYVVEGNTYELSNTYLNYLESNPSETPELGSTYTFLLDINGKIAGCQKDTGLAENQAYGYLINVKKDNINDRARLYIYTSKGEFKYFTTAETLEVNGYPKDGATTEEVDLLFAEEQIRSRVLKEITSEELLENRSYYNNVFAQGAILYKTNSADEIVELMTDTSGTLAYPSYKEYYDGLFVQAVGENTSLKYYGGVFGGKYIVTSKTTVLQVPQNLDDEDMFEYGPVVSGSFANSKEYVMEFYDVNEKGEVGLAIHRPAYEVSLDLYYDSGRLFYIFRDFSQQLNEEDEIVTAINYGLDDSIKTGEIASEERFRALADDELTKRAELGEKIKEVYEFYNFSDKDTEVEVNYNYEHAANVNELIFGDAIVVASSLNKVATVAPLLKMTGKNVTTGKYDVNLKDVHFEYGRSDLDVSDLVAGKNWRNLVDEKTNPFNDKGFENPSGRVIYYGEALESSSTSLTFFTTAKDDGNGGLVLTKRMVPTGSVDQTLFIDMTNQTVTVGSSSNIKAGDKVLVNFRNDIANNCYIYVYRW